MGSPGAWTEREGASGRVCCTQMTLTNPYTLPVVITCHSQRGIVPCINLPSDTLVQSSMVNGAYATFINTPPTVPPGILVPPNIVAGHSNYISWSASTDVDGDTLAYMVERKQSANAQFTDEAWTTIYDSYALNCLDTGIVSGSQIVQYRVRARDGNGGYSDYLTSSIYQVINNIPPTIDGIDTDLGTFGETGITQDYTIDDTDGTYLTVSEAIDNREVNAYLETSLPGSETLTLTDEIWTGVLNGVHTASVTVTDQYNDSAIRTYNFTKSLDHILIKNGTGQMVPKAEMPTMIVFSLSYVAPSDATLLVEVCNNGYDASPTWEDITDEVINSQPYAFTNSGKTASSWGIGWRVSLARASGDTSNRPCYISALWGSYQ